MQLETYSKGMEMALICRLNSMAYLDVELEDIVMKAIRLCCLYSHCTLSGLLLSFVRCDS